MDIRLIRDEQRVGPFIRGIFWLKIHDQPKSGLNAPLCIYSMVVNAYRLVYNSVHGLPVLYLMLSVFDE
jgi:hypothetical protein